MGAVVTAKGGYDIGYPLRGLNRGEERSAGGYYANAALAGEAAGRWFGRGAAALGLADGRQILRDAEVAAYESAYRQEHPVTGEQLGRRPANAGAVGAERRQAYLDRLLAAEPHARAERCRYLAWQATVATRPTAPYTDVTVSWSKSISVLHVSIRENARQARLTGDDKAAAWWDERERRFSEILQAGNRAALAHLEEWAGFTRTGSHAARIGRDQETGRWERAGIVVSSWLQGTAIPLVTGSETAEWLPVETIAQLVGHAGSYCQPPAMHRRVRSGFARSSWSTPRCAEVVSAVAIVWIGRIPAEALRHEGRALAGIWRAWQVDSASACADRGAARWIATS